ncbi:MAG: cysteine--tRNA ligase [Bdellovibrionota bacterium]
MSASKELPKITLTNTLGGKKEVFAPKLPGTVSIYSCGPTVYGKIHVGNAMAALTSDLVQRVFKLAGYKVEWATNITDVDDKIIKAANDEGTTAAEIAKRYQDIYLKEMNTLRVGEPAHRPKATECIPEMTAMIGQLIEKGFAYEASTPYGNDVYFRVRKFENYGKLSNKKIDELQVGARIEPGESKEDSLDFAMWKAAKEGEPSWDSPWGKGRPGWHIECSAMIHKHFPNGVDIHMGGLDLIFPHHENEIAQSEACSHTPLATYWVHNNLLTLEKEKMSKSIGNIFTTETFLENYGPEVLRLFLYQHHYRSPVDFSEEGITRTEALLVKLYSAKKNLLAIDPNFSCTACATWPEVEQALWDDFNTAKAMGLIMKALREAFRDNTPELWKKWSLSMKYFDAIYGILEGDPDEKIAEIQARKLKRLGVSQERAKEIEAKLELRTQMRASKNFAESDKLRAELEADGVVVMDNADASTWSVRA